MSLSNLLRTYECGSVGMGLGAEAIVNNGGDRRLRVSVMCILSLD